MAVVLSAPVDLYIQTRCMLEAGATSVELRVSDNGRGIDRQMQAQIFEPYVTTKPKGSGLGLAIVKKIVEEHGGMIRVENGPHGGACFIIRFPVIKQQTVPMATVAKELKA